MGRNSKMAVAAILALTIAGCAGDGGTQSSDPNAANPAPAETPAVQPPPPTQAFNNPVVPPKQVTAPVPTSTANLIQPTNTTERVGVVSRGRPDPFAQIVSAPVSIPVTTNNAPSERPVPVVPPLPTARNNPVIVRRRMLPGNSSVATVRPRIQRSGIRAVGVGELRRRNINNANRLALARRSKNPQRMVARAVPPRISIPVVPSKMPPVVRTPDLAPLAPPPPQPDMARAVVVTGIVQVGSAPQAIIKVPNEPTSRYVQAGQRLANGVLVKRIEMNDGSDPIIILEQYGIEVARTVGDGLRNVAQPTAANPV